MARRARSTDDSATTGLDELYAAPLDEFTAVRDALAKQLRTQGDGAAATRVKALRKPSTAVWAVNQLARREPARMEALLRAGERLRSAHGGAAVREAMRAQHDVVWELLQRATNVLAEAGIRSPGDHLDSIRVTLQSVPTASEHERERLRSGTLATELEPADFGDVMEMLAARPGGATAEDEEEEEETRGAKKKAKRREEEREEEAEEEEVEEEEVEEEEAEEEEVEEEEARGAKKTSRRGRGAEEAEPARARGGAQAGEEEARAREEGASRSGSREGGAGRREGRARSREGRAQPPADARASGAAARRASRASATDGPPARPREGAPRGAASGGAGHARRGDGANCRARGAKSRTRGRGGQTARRQGRERSGGGTRAGSGGRGRPRGRRTRARRGEAEEISTRADEALRCRHSPNRARRRLQDRTADAPAAACRPSGRRPRSS
ncbi:hypothetical protein [Nannocystis pusilla]|uniref:hypothetical protein n=1 Tax=Nannocystis pusilla TaxID=889268 RepID=UPI003B7FB050